jgi:tRNA pseudouridine65 synthase
MASDLSILFQDQGLLAIDKPSGLSVHRGLDGASDTVVARLRALGMEGARPVHRLDRPTSGVLLCALSTEVASACGRAFAEQRPHKIYLALVRGVCPDEALIDHPVPSDEDGPRVPARTLVRRIEAVTIERSPLKESRYSLVRAEPETGRFHQVRRHLKHIGHPVVGDSTYGRSEHNRLCAERFGLGRLALHAASLSIALGEPNGAVTIESPLPPDLKDPLRGMGFTIL